MLAPFSAQVGLGTIFESTYLRKIVFSRNITLFNGFCSKLTPRWGQDRPKIAPRWVQDRLGSPFFRLDFSLRFLIVVGSILDRFGLPNGAPGGAAELCKSARGRSKTVLGSSWVGPFFVLRFGFAFLSLLGHSWNRFGSLLVYFWAILGSLEPVLGRLGLVLGHSGWHVGVL